MTNGLERLSLSANRHYLQTESGAPFFWLGDTAWNLFHLLSYEEAEHYFATRAQQGFTVIQAVLISEHDALFEAYNGGQALYDDDPLKPNLAYFDRVDAYLELALKYGLYIAVLPTWGHKVFPMWTKNQPVFTPENAFAYGQFVGKRFARHSHLIWCLGGDRPPVYEGQDFRPVWRAIASGIKEHDSKTLMTYHPSGSSWTSATLQEEDWLDIHMMQSGHGAGHDYPVWNWIARDWELSPIRPSLDAEPNYEDHPVNPWPNWNPENGYFRDHDVRKQCYRSVFAGGCGVTYGHHFVWQMYDPKRQPINNGNELICWQDALRRPAAEQLRYLRKLIESRPQFVRQPDQSLLDYLSTGRHEYPVATRDESGSYAFIYLPLYTKFRVNTAQLSGDTLVAWWYNPRTGSSQEIASFPKLDKLTFTTPTDGPDWVLVLDDKAANYLPPGQA
ncbi:MAG: glycoside hydrolase family 140 protein [Trueperaceae bacterium]|nr:glycoside hydrolase family 140 protein [Trueperaceae bacterium]